jgi:hypothetical protein
MVESSVPSVSFSTVSESWILFTAALVMIISLIEAWLATLIVYGGVHSLKKVFKAPQNLIRSHVDYTIMTALLIVAYFVINHLSLSIPSAVIVLLCAGAIYNPLGFLIKAINPKAGKSDTVIGRIMVCLGFLPTTIGFGYIMLDVMFTLL